MRCWKIIGPPNAAWRKLKTTDLLPGKSAPSIRAALVIEPNEPTEKNEDKDQDDDKTMIDEDLDTQFVDDQSR